MTVQAAKPLLRVGIIIDSFAQPRWVRKSLENIFAAGVSTFELVVKVPAEKIVAESLLYKLYNRMDRSVFVARQDALEPVNIEHLVGRLPGLQADEMEKIRAFNLDVLIDFTGTELKSRFAGLAKYGVWFCVFGTDENAPPGLRELLTDDKVMTLSLRSLNGQTSGERVIYQSFSPTLTRFSVGLNNNECYWKSAAFVARSLVDLYSGRREMGIVPRPGGSLEPTNATMARMFLKLTERAASRVFEKLSSSGQWILAYRIGDTEFKYLDPPPDRFWADPFPITVAGKHYIFFEDYLNSLGRAHISVIEVDQKGIVSGPTEVLKLDCHLSYPFVFEWHGECYMIPETGDKNVVELYRSVSFPFEWQLEQVLLEVRCPLDTTLIEVDGTWWMFVNIQEEGVAVNWDELHLYYSDSPLGPWKPHARNPVVSDVRSARPAGRLFWCDDLLYRPSQDSSMGYGYATTINRITSLSRTEYAEIQVAKILPDWDKDIIGVHTLNATSEITVIDCLVKRRRFRSSKLRPLPALGITENLLRRQTSRK